MNAQYALDLCARIARHTDIPNQISRFYLSPATLQVHTLLRAEMHRANLTPHLDSAGNLRGISNIHDPATPTLLLGSHIDTVPNAGPYDGILGVALPLAVLQVIPNQQLPFNVQLVAFSEEEGVRFRLPFIGSRALVGSLTADDLQRTDSQGITLASAMPGDPRTAILPPTPHAFLEIHIEQGPILDSLDHPLGLVEAIVGQSRQQLTFTGQANHAGTTPMNLRRDALAAAAEFILFAESLARTTPGLVATVGSISANPNAVNVIPGHATLSLDLRHADDTTRTTALSTLLTQAQRIATARLLTLQATPTSAQSAVAMDPDLTAALESACLGATYKPLIMNSGAGHDALILAPHLPTAMLFLRSPLGLSHHPQESVRPADVEAAFDVLHAFLTGNFLTPQHFGNALNCQQQR